MINDTPNLDAPMADLGPFLRRRVDGRPRLMGIVNVTPDSFHAGSRVDSVTEAVAVGLSMWDAGADWVDVGGKSTRPAARPVAVEEELERVIPVITALKELVITDSIRPTDAAKDSERIRILTIAPLVGEAVRRIADESSVSSLFD